MSARELITEHLDLWTGAVTKKSNNGRGSNGKVELTGVKKLRELILELAVRGKLASQDTPTESSSDLIAVMEREKAKLVNSKRIKRPKVVGSVSQENHPFDIPDNWSWHSLGALGYTQTGSTPAKSQSELFGSDIPFLKPGDISESGEICYDNEGLSEAGKEVLGKWAEKDSILMVCIGTIGKCGLIEQQCTFNQQINSVTPFAPEISQFLLLCLKSPYFQSAAWEKSSSTTISILNKGKWESIPVPLPPLEEQQRIVQKVDELMALCDRLEQQTTDQLEAHETLVDTLLGTLTQSENATELADNWARLATHFETLFTTEQSIDKLKQTILQLAVMGRLVEQDAGDEPVIPYLGSFGMKATKHRLPGWAQVGLGSLGEIIGGATPSKRNLEFWNGVTPWVSPKDMKVDQISDSKDHVSEAAIENSPLRVIPPQSLLMVVRGMILAHSFPVAMTTASVTINQDMKALVPPSDLAPYLLLFLKAQKVTVTNLVDRSSHGTCKLKSEKLWTLPVSLPPIKEQERILQKVDELMVLCDKLKERLNQASETRSQLAETIVEQALS